MSAAPRTTAAPAPPGREEGPGPGGEPRTLAPFGRRVARVVSNDAVGAYRVISAADPAGPSDPRPGQFYMLATAARWGAGAGERPYLPRAFSHCRVQPAASGDGEGPVLGFLLDAVGPGTERLGALAPGDDLWLVGPLGIGFRPPPPDPAARALLVGGGIGVAPILCLDDALRGAGSGRVPHGSEDSGHVPRPGEDSGRVPQGGAGSGPVPRRAAATRTLLGFRSADHAGAARLFAGSPAVCTDDGSAGRRGLVTELLREELDRHEGASVYACGPPPMLEAVRALCSERGVPAQLALESGMACGYGGCFGCAVPTRAGYVRLCVDGPVLDAAALDTALLPGAGH